MIKDMESYLQDLHARRTLGAGTAKDVATQHGKNRLTARERIDLLFDSGTFTEIDTLVLPRHESYPGGGRRWARASACGHCSKLLTNRTAV